jgi:hypothetical protein
MGRCQRGVHFGAVGLKTGEERSKFPIANFCFTFFLHYFYNSVILWQLKTKISDLSNNFLKKFHS